MYIVSCTSGLPDGIFSNQNSNFGKFWRDLQCKMLVYFMAIISILRPFGLFVVIGSFCGHLVFLWSFGLFMVIWSFCGHLVFLWSFGLFVVIWYILWLFGIFFTIMVCCTQKNLATLLYTRTLVPKYLCKSTVCRKWDLRIFLFHYLLVHW
jgi:hypothetical protein